MRHIYRTALYVLILAVLGACGQNNVIPTAVPLPTAVPTATPPPTTTPRAVTNESLEQARPSLVRIINAAADTPPLNVFAGFSAIATNLAYKQYTEPTSFDAGSYTIKVQLSGSQTNDKPLIETNLDFASGTSFMILITGSGQHIKLATVNVASEAIRRTESIIQLVNGTADNSSINLKTATRALAENLASEQSIMTPAIPEGKTDFTFQVGDKGLNYTANLKGQMQTTLIVAGTASNPEVIQFVSPAPKRIQARAINASAEITSIDVYVDDILLNKDVGYGRTTERKNLAAGQYTVRAYAAGSDRSTVEPLTGQVVSLIDGDTFNIVLLGTANQLSLMVYADNLTTTQTNMARIQFLNTVPSVARANVQASAGSFPAVPDLYYGQTPSTTDAQAGTYSFLIAGIDDQNVGSTLELAENIQFQAGYNYLYLITGRQDGKPIIISDKVDINGEAVASTTTDGQQAAQVRFINASANKKLDLLINGALVITGEESGTGSNLVDISDQTATLATRISGQEQDVGQEDTTLEAGKRYSIVAFDGENATVGLLVINDDNLIFDGNSPHIRLINVSSNSEDNLGLAFSEVDTRPTPTGAAEIPITPEITADPNQETQFFTLPFGVQKVVNEVRGGSASSVILMPLGPFDLHVIESANNKLALTLPNINLPEGVHIDLVAYKDDQSGMITGFAINYPKPS